MASEPKAGAPDLERGRTEVTGKGIDKVTKSTKIEVQNSGIFEIQVFPFPPDGNLFVAEAGKNIPFEIKRIYFINAVANPRAVRGCHAHKTLEQILFCINGSFVLHLDDGTVRQSITLDNPSLGIRLGPRLWHSMTSFSYDCVILVLANDWFNEADYIRDYDRYCEYIQG